MSSTHLRGIKPPLSKDKDPLTKAPPAPSWLSDEAKAEWKRIMPRLISEGIITRADLSGVENFCIMTGRVREIEAMLQTDGFDKMLHGAQVRAAQTARQLAAEFGLSPTSRTRANKNQDESPNPLSIGRSRAHA